MLTTLRSLENNTAYSLTREAVMKLRSARARIYDETNEHKVTLNLAHVRTIFYATTTVKKLIFPLHPDKRTSAPTTEPNYKMAFNFLTEIARPSQQTKK